MSTVSKESDQDETLVNLYRRQTRVVASFFVGKALMITVILFEIFADDLFSNIGLFTIHVGVVFLYCACNLVGYFLLSFSAFLLDVKYYFYGYMTILGGFAYWCAATTVGFISASDIFIFVCVDQRCPESHWLINMRWRNYGIKCPKDPLEKPRPEEAKGGPGKSLAALYFNCERADVFLIIISSLLALSYFVFMLVTLVRTHRFYKMLKGQLERIEEEMH
ncbi:uncharacterized protein LOC106669331 [Cimex lectularius]|uniref:Uncharacterized protein n=1 Tax=Cimex lectularius TaxID=79782 RepID=A0A8I6S1R0_CIMLE|nr:uncharacterized protein LOC106669331 [Cimex lectularius]